MTHGHSVKGGLLWYMDGSTTNKDTGAGVYIWGSRRRQSFIPGLHTTVFQAKMYNIKAQVMKNITRKATSIKCNTKACVLTIVSMEKQ
jgi:hypothetical protein